MTDNDKPDEGSPEEMPPGRGMTSLEPEARVHATASAETIIGFDLEFKPKPSLRADLASLAKQTDGRATETLNVIIEDSDSTCEQFEFNIGNLTQKQAKTLFVQIVNRREVEEQRERELEKVALQSSLGFIGRLFSWLGRGS